jgi:sphingosine kinase
MNKEDQESFVKMIEPLPRMKVEYTKPIAIIYNPNSGKKIDIRAHIRRRLDEANIKYEFLESKVAFDTWRIANTLDIEKYSALIPVGGDGTFHDVVNGMLFREDKKRLPIGLIGNGSAHDSCSQYESFNTDIMLNHIIKGDIIK